MNREQALQLWKEFNTEEHLFRHALAVEAAMREYARYFSEDEELWGICGLLHDIDFENYPESHPNKGVEILTEKNYPHDLVQAVKEHAEENCERQSRISKALYASDEMASFIVAVAMVRPTGLDGMKAKSVTKKMKTKQFAAKVNRDQLQQSATDLGMELNDHINLVIQGLQHFEERLQKEEHYSLLQGNVA